MEAFARGLAQDQVHYGLQLTGGDTFRSPDRLIVSVTMFAAIEAKHYKSRLTAGQGEALYVSGTIGNSALGLKVATGELSPPAGDDGFLTNAYRLPDPPAAIYSIIAEHASACMDISDGLLGDCRKLCRASGLGRRNSTAYSLHEI